MGSRRPPLGSSHLTKQKAGSDSGGPPTWRGAAMLFLCAGSQRSSLGGLYVGDGCGRPLAL